MIGVDEVGRGCIAGPLLVVAIRTECDLPEGVKDSKLLTKNQREELYKTLERTCQSGEGWVNCDEIDKHGLAHALRLGVDRALKKINAQPAEQIILDGPINYAPNIYKNVQALINADNLIPLVSAASIIAKVKRDRHMAYLAKEHPHYYLDSNVGYGTPQHLQALRQFGPRQMVHRFSFAPLRQTSLW